MRAESPSVQMRKRVGKRGSPCRSPQVGIMFPHAVSFMRTEYETEEKHLITRSIHLELNPNFSMTPFMNHHSTLSKALLISSLEAIYPSPPAFL